MRSQVGAPKHIPRTASLGRMAGTSATPDHRGMSDLTVYHDGSCPLCQVEIGHYRRQAGAENIQFVDVSDPDNDPGPGVSRQDAMGRFHVRLPTGQLQSGAAAFIAVWKVLPRWRRFARVMQLPGMTRALDIGYAIVAPVRPSLARIVGRVTKR